MKKTLLFSFFIMLGQACLAQGINIEDYRNNVLTLGLKAGLGMTTISGQPEECDLIDSGSMGFSAGIAAKARFGRATDNSRPGSGLLGAAVELKYRQAKAKTIADDDLSLGYFEVPVLLQIYPVCKQSALNGLYIEAGPEFALLISKSPDKLHVPLSQTVGQLQSVTYHTGDLKGGDVRLAVGVGYTVPNTGLDINFRYHLGMGEMAKNSLPCKMRAMELSVAWLFNLTKF